MGAFYRIICLEIHDRKTTPPRLVFRTLVRQKNISHVPYVVLLFNVREKSVNNWNWAEGWGVSSPYRLYDKRRPNPNTYCKLIFPNIKNILKKSRKTSLQNTQVHEKKRFFKDITCASPRENMRTGSLINIQFVKGSQGRIDLKCTLKQFNRKKKTSCKWKRENDQKHLDRLIHPFFIIAPLLLQ